MRGGMKLFWLALCVAMGLAAPALAGDYASDISDYRKTHKLSAVKLDSRLNAGAMEQARAAEKSGAGFLTFSEMLKQWEDSAGHRENLLMAGARRVGVASVNNPKSPYRKFWAMVITD